MKTNKEIGMLFSGGKFNEAAGNLAEEIEWNIYENGLNIKGKESVLEFCKKVAEYFKSITTNFTMFDILGENNKVSIYGHAEFIKEGKILNVVNSCEIYEFDGNSNIQKIYSYCNSKKPSS